MCLCAQELLQQGGAGPETLQGLKLAGQQFLWGGRECDEARRLQQQLLEVEQWAQQVGVGCWVHVYSTHINQDFFGVQFLVCIRGDIGPRVGDHDVSRPVSSAVT